jgi:hypothetical protein
VGTGLDRQSKGGAPDAEAHFIQRGNKVQFTFQIAYQKKAMTTARARVLVLEMQNGAADGRGKSGFFFTF